MSYILLMGAGLAGAGGVALSAIAAHKAESASLTTAALLLILHAVAVVGLVAASQAGFGRGLLAAAWVLLIGAFLFTITVAKLTLHGSALFPMSAPAGGVLMIVGWLTVAIAAIGALAQR